ncbi:MAG: alpha-1,2-fucosyltransferase [Winogradskyella sp.]|uniref:alpha-1,2-fucosyltransferase n=1 Tax=Winogradskyella sp. TaxID=1883156 RepID=UPI00180BFE4A|nr:alpha-1,2-fucosyltransferase [Winogradskyella sp.]
MIIIKLQGGLGNQMFQYAIARILGEIRDEEVLLDITSFEDNVKKPGYTPRNFELNIFNNSYKIADRKAVNRFKKINVINRLKQKLGFSYPQTYVETSFRFNEELFSIENDIYLVGYFQSYKYLKNHEAFTRQLYSFQTNSLSELNQNLLVKLKTLKTVSIHIRRGDFVNDKLTQAYHGICNLEYYIEAIEYICSKHKNLTMVFFSDDMQWVRESFNNFDYPKIFVDFNSRKNNWVDMLLMSKCSHNIIANSSFSWWGAWLNTNPKKTVVAPKKWFTNEDIDTSTLLPKEWKKM